MTTAKSSSTNPGAIRGRGLDALFEETVSPSATSHSVDADLAALLDNEVMAAETGSNLGEAVPSTAAVSGRRSDFRARGDEPLVGVDLPPVAAEAQPVPAVEPESLSATPVASAPTPEPQPERHLPTTQRFGAIIMDTSIEPHACRTGSAFRRVGADSSGNQVHPAAGLGRGTRTTRTTRAAGTH